MMDAVDILNQRIADLEAMVSKLETELWRQGNQLAEADRIIKQDADQLMMRDSDIKELEAEVAALKSEPIETITAIDG